MRNPTITILKAIAIILVVIAHSGSPISNVAYMLCVSLFFVASGYCFNPKYLNDETTFVKRRFRRLYVPFVLCSVFFLLLNHFWFYTGILNEQYGNPSGGVTHPLNLHAGLQALWSICFNMSGYDQFLCGAYWFFRCLLVSSIAFLVLMKLFGSVRWLKSKLSLTATAVALTAIGFALWQVSDDLRVTGLAQGGYREFMAIFFISAGFLYRRMEDWLAQPAENADEIADFDAVETATEVVLNPIAGATVAEESADGASPTSKGKTAKTAMELASKSSGFIVSFAQKITRALCSHSFITMPMMLAMLVGILYIASPSMKASEKTFSGVLLLAASGVAGFSLVYNVSDILRRIVPLRKILVFIGENTLYVLLWHLLAFKLVSMIKVGVYGLPWNMVGCHPVIFTDEGTWFWILYVIVGVGLPLGIVALIRYCQNHYNIDSYAKFVRVFIIAVWSSICFCGKWSWRGIRFGSVKLWAGLCWIVTSGWKQIYDFCIRFVDTVKAGYDVNQDKEDLDDEEYDSDEDDDEDDDDDEDEYEDE